MALQSAVRIRSMSPGRADEARMNIRRRHHLHRCRRCCTRRKNILRHHCHNHRRNILHWNSHCHHFGCAETYEPGGMQDTAEDRKNPAADKIPVHLL